MKNILIFLFIVLPCLFVVWTFVTDLHNDQGNIWIEKEYYENGRVESETQYVDGERHGTYKEYYENGQVKSEVLYVRDDRHGTYKEYYKTGELKSEVPYVGGEIYGISKSYYESGQLKSKSRFVLMTDQGTINYDRKGNIIK